MFLTVIAFIFVLGLLIIIHELGHFLFARRYGVKVEEFAFGFGPALWKKRKKDVLWRMNLVPLGGYVKLLGEDEFKDDSKEENSFAQQKRSAKAVIIISGVLMNFVLAWLIFTIGFMIGMPSVNGERAIAGAKTSRQVMIGGIQENSAAQKAGLEFGDIIIALSERNDSITVVNPEDVQNFTKENHGKEITVRLENNTEKKITLSDDSKAPLGVYLIDYATVKTPIWLSPFQALTETGWGVWLTLKGIYVFFKNLLINGEVMEGASGPVGIFVYTQAAIQIGLPVFLQFIAILSINLGLINILPFPALDGGRLVFIGLEGIFRRKTRLHEIEHIIHWFGFVLLIILMLAITYKDVLRLGG